MLKSPKTNALADGLIERTKNHPSQRNCQNQLSHPSFVSHRVRTSGEFDSRKDSYSTELEQRPQKFVKLSFRELCGSKLSGLYPFDNMAIIH